MAPRSDSAQVLTSADECCCRYIDTWSLSPPTIKRLLRCNADDLAAMKHFITLTTPPAEGPDTPEATILVEARNDWSELWSGLGSPNYNCEVMNGE